MSDAKKIDRAIERFFPKRAGKEWLRKNLGINGECDIFALNKSFNAPVWDFLGRGGKRWRPVLMLLCCEAVGGDARKAIEFAPIPELLHNASLILDDIEDNSSLRRGKPALHVAYGLDTAANVGSGLCHLPYLVVRNSGLNEKMKADLYALIAEETVKIHLGQALDIFWHKNSRIPKEGEYLQMAALKSGTLPRLAAKLGAKLGGGSEKQASALGNFAESLGVAFQIHDDVLGISGKTLGKDFGEDINEGKKSLPILHTLAVADKKDKTCLLDIISPQKKDTKHIKEAIAIIKKYESADYSKNLAENLINTAWKKTEKALPGSKAREKLKMLADFLIKR